MKNPFAIEARSSTETSMRNKRQRSSRVRNLSDLQTKLEQGRQELTRQMFAKLRDVRAESAAQRCDSMEDFGHVEARDELVAAIIEMKSETLSKIEKALRLIEEGRYGTCAECGAQIAENRLLAVPFALRCTPCEEAHETQSQTSRRAWIVRGNDADL